MKCSEARKLISPYFDGELSEANKRELESHVRVCESCRSEIRETQELHQLFVNEEKYDAPFGFHVRVMANVKTAKPGWSPRIPFAVWLAEGALILLLIAVGIMSGSLLTQGLSPDKAENEIATLHLDVFNSAPPGTLGGAYLAMTEVRNEK